MEMKPILIVDDEKNIRLTVFQPLEPEALSVQTAAKRENVLQKSEERPFCKVSLHLKTPGISGEPGCTASGIPADFFGEAL